MQIAIASGKGGAGKTTITSSLAAVWDTSCIVADADVEAPNLHLFLDPEITTNIPVFLEVPVLDKNSCSSCGKCAEFCRYKAIASLGKKIVVFPEMCHGCGGCFALCPDNALLQGKRLLGELESGSVLQGKHKFIMGRSRIGEAMSPPQLRALQEHVETMACKGQDILIDAPPGVSCPAMTAVMEADLILLAAEPTPFGFHDFKLAHQAFLPLKKNMAVVINRASIPGNDHGDEELRQYCATEGLPLLAELPFDRAIAEHYAKGQVLALLSDTWRDRFRALRDALMDFRNKEHPHA